jgi:UTP-glucose-1-phosphate uridylyltransferase
MAACGDDRQKSAADVKQFPLRTAFFQSQQKESKGFGGAAICAKNRMSKKRKGLRLSQPLRFA